MPELKEVIAKCQEGEALLANADNIEMLRRAVVEMGTMLATPIAWRTMNEEGVPFYINATGDPVPETYEPMCIGLQA